MKKYQRVVWDHTKKKCVLGISPIYIEKQFISPAAMCITLSARKIWRGLSGFVTGCPCGVWRHGLTTIADDKLSLFYILLVFIYIYIYICILAFYLYLSDSV